MSITWSNVDNSNSSTRIPAKALLPMYLTLFGRINFFVVISKHSSKASSSMYSIPSWNVRLIISFLVQKKALWQYAKAFLPIFLIVEGIVKLHSTKNLSK